MVLLSMGHVQGQVLAHSAWWWRSEGKDGSPGAQGARINLALPDLSFHTWST